MGFDPFSVEPDDLPPLWCALRDRDFGTASRLIESGARLDDLIEEDGNTLLHDAAQDGDREIVDFFLDHDCPRTLESFDYISSTPLIRAAQHGQTDVVVRLLAGHVDPNANDEERIGNTAIREAVQKGHKEIVSQLLRAGADPTIPGWMAISAVDQAWSKVRGTPEVVQEIRAMLAGFPSELRDKQGDQ